MSFEDKKYTNSKVDPTVFFNLGTYFEALESTINSIKAPIISDYAKLKKLTIELSGLLEKSNLSDTNNWLASLMKAYDEEYEDYLNKRSIPQSGVGANQLRYLRRDINSSFNDGEIRTLCSDLGVDYEELSGETISNKIQSLIGYCERHRKLLALVEICIEERPDIQWLDGQFAYKCLKTEEWQKLRWMVTEKVNDELKELTLIHLPGFQPPPYPDQIEEIYNCFDSREQFDSLPELAQSILQEAINCFACGQYTASVMLVWSVTKITIDEYYQRSYAYLPGFEGLSNDSWDEYLLKLPENDVIRNKTVELIELRKTPPKHIVNSKDAWLIIREAINFCSALVKKWETGARLTVEVFLPIDRDIFWALVLLEKYGGGIGHLKITLNSFSSEYLNEDEPVVVMQVNTNNLNRLLLSRENDSEFLFQTVKLVADACKVNKQLETKIEAAAKESPELRFEKYLEYCFTVLPQNSKLLPSMLKVKQLLDYSQKANPSDFDDVLLDLELLKPSTNA